ncbi:MAG: LON peptidase substrate-binding domain-containing protein [Paracoccaceae bacterium]
MKRFNSADLPRTIPLFPLPGALLLPRTKLPLNIFEPRYLAMLDDTLKTSERLIGMVQPLESPDSRDESRLHRIGCAGRVVAFNETEDGRYQITLGGVSRFRLVAQQDGFAAYPRGDVEWNGFEHDLGKCEPDEGFDRPAFLDILSRYFRAAAIKSDWDSLKEADEELLINSLAMLCPFEPEEKQALLEAPTLANRRETIVTLMEFELASGHKGGSLQ